MLWNVYANILSFLCCLWFIYEHFVFNPVKITQLDSDYNDYLTLDYPPGFKENRNGNNTDQTIRSTNPMRTKYYNRLYDRINHALSKLILTSKHLKPFYLLIPKIKAYKKCPPHDIAHANANKLLRSNANSYIFALPIPMFFGRTLSWQLASFMDTSFKGPILAGQCRPI